ncbi:DsrE/DsrF/DrsH-like family protein [Acetobacterium tundrae]|uniref:Pyridine nucleotide-disulfide oxidoreductase n=1 Tax=Acetobacterium tundrae TaxID=132932 RepID=A0ABR6WI17_9FIRM|nr:DsrE/DsrF/DrsH-like family protein [Acetobacterium tundrae]MBC3795792.1 pyridine nucleotide-disulfide oxidoreductase [Acetobacterium tundrae]
MGKKVLIVGGVAGGASAAARLRRLDETAEIILFERDEYISFANCGLPYYIGETIKDRNKLLVQTPEAMKARFNIDVRNNSEVISVDAKNKKVVVKSKTKGTYEESYDYLILSPGGKAIRPNIPGINSEKIFTLRNIPDTDIIKAYVDKKGINHAVVIGGGFIGVEMAENLRDRGLNVTLVEAAPHILAPFDPDMVVIAEKELAENGVGLILGDGVKSFEEIGNQVQITLGSNTKINADIIILAIGVSPDTAFLKESGLAFGPKGHIIVNEKMETNLEGVYAVGDAIEVVDFITKQKTAIALAGPANKQGRIAADNVAGLNATYKGTQGSSILKIFGLTAASTGANERTLQRASMPYQVIYVHPVSHASYYPGAIPMSLKLIFNEEGRVLGAQGIGYDGVDKRIDVIATAIRFNGTVDDLAELELSYAPPFSSAKDPVNMAGFVAQNVLADRMNTVAWKDIEKDGNEDTMLLDVRTELEFSNGHLDGAINIPVDSLRERMNELDKNKTIIEYCQVGLRGYIAARILSQNGFKVANVTGGYKTSSMLHYAPEKPDTKDSNSNSSGSSNMSIDPDTQAIRIDENKTENYDKQLDTCGLCCPGPLMQVKASMDELKDGQILKVTASDPGFYEDIKAWCKRTNNELLDLKKIPGNITAFIKKNASSAVVNQNSFDVPAKDNKTIVVFSGDLDKAMAAFIIANGAASMGKKVTMFFTFWGLNILRKPEKVEVKKGLIDSMFGAMMPRGTNKLKISKMNMGGMGTAMMRKVMNDKNITSLDELVKAAIDSGIELVACQMSMDVMGIHHEEMIDGVKLGGVGYMLGEAEDSNVNFFI